MAKSLLEQLPTIVAEGKREAERIMERLESAQRIGLQTRELVIPSRDTNWQNMFARAEKATHDLDPANMNRLIYGDNLLAMAALLAGSEDTPSMRGKVDLIYIDPPFDSKADYRTKITLPGGDIEQKPTALEQFAYSDTWQDGTASYLAMLSPRLYLMKEIIQKDGTIAVHIGPTVSHYVKIILDEIFGKDFFLNEVVWQRRLGQSNADRKKMGVVTDSIFIYTKSEDFYFNPQFSMEGAEDYIKERYTKVDERGRRYKTGDLGNPAPRPNLRYEYKGHKPPPNGWAVSLETMMRMDSEGRLEFPAKVGGRLMRRQFLDEWKGKPIQSLWDDIPPINSQAKERIGYDTQKPEKLIQRIVDFFAPEGALIADFFGGSGTTSAVAEKSNRRWIVTDFGKPSCMIARKRMIDQNAKPFLYQHVGDYQVEMARSTLGRKFRMGDLSEIVLGLFGALPLPAEENPNRNMGRVHGTRTLVLADSPNKLTGLATLKRAIEIRDNLMGGWEKVIVLGWNFDSNIGHDIQALNQGDRLEVLVIPPDLLDRLKKKGGKLKADEVRLSSLQYVKVKPIERKRDGEKEALTITIDNYVLLSPDALNLDEANKEKLQKVMNKDPMALIEYWSVDPDYDGQVFRSVWQDYRGNTENDDDPFRVVTTAQLTDLPAKDGKRRVCVRVVDVFGFEAEAITEV